MITNKLIRAPKNMDIIKVYHLFTGTWQILLAIHFLFLTKGSSSTTQTYEWFIWPNIKSFVFRSLISIFNATINEINTGENKICKVLWSSSDQTFSTSHKFQWREHFLSFGTFINKQTSIQIFWCSFGDYLVCFCEIFHVFFFYLKVT